MLLELLLQTPIASRVIQSALSIRLSISTLSSKLSDLWPSVGYNSSQGIKGHGEMFG